MGLTRPRYSQIYDTDHKQSVTVATTGDVGNLLATGNLTNTIDTILLKVNDRILVKDQTNAAQNGIYSVVTVGTGSNGTWQRALDANSSDKVTSGLTVIVSTGGANATKTFRLTTIDPITLGTTPLTFVNPFVVTATPGGANTQVQFNDVSQLGGSAAFTFNKFTNTLSVSGGVTSSGVINTTGNILATGGILNSLTVNGGITSSGFINTTANISAAIARAGTITTTGTLTAAVVNSTGNILGTGGILNSLTVNGTSNIILGGSTVGGTITLNKPTLSGGPSAFIRRYDGGYNTVTTANTLYEIGRFTFTGISHNITISGEVRAIGSQNNGTARFVLNARSNDPLTNKGFTFTQENLNLGYILDIEAWHDTLTGLVVIGYRSASGFQNVGWSILTQERANFNYFIQTTSLTTLDTTGLTQITLTSPGYNNDLRLLSTTASTTTGTGALVVSGGVGVQGTVTAGQFNTPGNVLASTVTGSTVAVNTSTPTSPLHVVTAATGEATISYGSGNVTYPTAPTAINGIIGKGANADFRTMIQDGSGRVNMYWNTYTDAAGQKYQVSSEPSARYYMGVNSTTGGLHQWFGAAAGTANALISWTQVGSMTSGTGGSVWFSPQGNLADFNINDTGNVAIGASTAYSKLDVNGAINGVIPGYTVKLDSTYNRTTLVSFVTVATGYHISAGDIFMGTFTAGWPSVLFEMKIFATAQTTATQYCYYVDDGIYFFLNGSTTGVSPVSVTTAGAKTTTVTWTIPAGMNTISILCTNSGAGPGGFGLLGDFLVRYRSTLKFIYP